MRDERYRNKVSKTGVFSIKIPKEVNERLTEYCKNENINKTRFVIALINKEMRNKLLESYNNMSKEELIKKLIEQKKLNVFDESEETNND